jgi:histidine triad (HIT) family protein
VLSLTHEPEGYSCPFCRMQRGLFDERNLMSDVIAVTDRAFARIAPKWWPANPGAVLVIPRAHVENIYALPVADGHAIWDLTQCVAEAIRATYACDGTSTRQHNEPAGGQDVWHVHMHVFPRYDRDDLYERDRESTWVTPEAREPYALKLRRTLGMAHAFGE